MTKSRFKICLKKEFNIEFDEKPRIIDTIDANDDGLIDFDEFKVFMLQPNSLEVWASSLPLAALVADAVSAVTDAEHSKDLLDVLCELDESSINSIKEAVGFGIGLLLDEQKKKVLEARQVMSKAQTDSGSCGKFEVFEMSTGDVGNFHGGLEGRIGAFL